MIGVLPNGLSRKTFRESLKKIFSFEKMGTKLIAEQLAKQGITLSEEQLSTIETSIKNLEGDTLTIQIDDLPQGEDQLDRVLQFDLDELDNLTYEVMISITDATPNIIKNTSYLLLEQLKRDAPRMLKEHKREREAFEAQLSRRRGTALNLLEMFIVIAFEVGAAFNQEFRPKAAKENNYVFDVLTRLHARACQVAYEVLTLLQAGFADGAHARWRTLHEIAVVGWLRTGGMI